MRATWPMLYTEDNQLLKPMIAGWAERVDAGKGTPESLAAEHYVPLESVVHALSCYYFDLGEPRLALAMANTVLDKKPDWRLHIQRIRILMVMPEEQKEAMYADAALWGKLYVDGHEKAQPDSAFADWDLNPDKRLHLGFVCTYFNSFPSLTSLKPVLARLNRKKFRVTLFSVNEVVDDWLTPYVDECINILTVDPDVIVRTIAERKVDLLFDLNGYLRLDFPAEVFVRRPAPVQVVWFNTLTSSGIASMHYFLSAGDLLKAEDYKYFSEKICLLPSRATATFEAVEYPITPPPSTTGEYFTFGSFTALFKINDEVLETWAEILQKSPKKSRMFIKAAHIISPRFLERAMRIFTAYGVGDNRLICEELSPVYEMMIKFSQLDLCLNTFSYGACSTTANALWQGVPTLTMDGDVLQARVSAEFMRKAGLSQFIARDRQDFIEKAVYYAHHPLELVELRRTLRPHLRTHPNFNASLFTPEFEEACRWMWKDWLASSGLKRSAA